MLCGIIIATLGGLGHNGRTCKMVKSEEGVAMSESARSVSPPEIGGSGVNGPATVTGAHSSPTPSLRLALKMFSYGFAIDVFYVVWIRAVSSGSALLAGFAAVALASPALFGYLEIVGNRRLIKFYLLGLFFGTVCATLGAAYV